MGDIMQNKGVPLDDRPLGGMVGGIVRMLVFPEGQAELGPLKGKIVEVVVPQVRFRQMVAQLTPSHAKLLANLAEPPTRQQIERSVREGQAMLGLSAAEASAALLAAYRTYADNPGAALALLHYGAALCLTEMAAAPPPPSATITVVVPTDEIEAAISRLRAEADRVIGLAGATSGGIEYAIVAQELQRVRAERDALRARSLGPKAEAAMEAVWWLAGALVRAEETGDRDDRKLADRLHDQLHGHAMVLALSGERRADRRTDLTPDARRAAEVLLLAEQLAQARSAMRETWLPAATREADQWEKTFLARLDALYDEAEAARDAEARATVEAERRAVRAITGHGATSAPGGA